MASPADPVAPESPGDSASSRPSFGPPRYEFPEFRPLRWLSGGHAQTIAGVYAPHRRIPHTAIAHEVALPDGDRTLLHDDCPSAWQPGDPCVLLVHGLGGSHRSPYMVRIASKFQTRRIRAFRLDLRGHGAAWRLAQHPGHAGRSEDVAAALAAIDRLCPSSPIVSVGVSMGANILLKLLGERAADAPATWLGALAIAPPIDLAYCSMYLRDEAHRVYTKTFLRGLIRQVELRKPLSPALARLDIPRRMESVWEFDDRVTAPLSGFADAAEYYAQSSSAPLLDRIRIPTAILTAADDPLIPPAMFHSARVSSTVRVHITPHGGHVGYLAAAGADPDRRWLDWRAIEFVESILRHRPT